MPEGLPMTPKPAPFKVERPVAESLPPPPPARAEALRARPTRRVAVFVCHGMGQQVRFQTIDGLATALQAYAESHQKVRPQKPAVRIVKLGDKQLGRAELTLDSDGETTNVHVYEGYWAPLTEGRITLGATVLFFLKSGWQGIHTSLFRRRFVRYLFGHFESWPRSFSTPLEFAGGLTVIAALIAINAVQAGVLLAWVGRGSVWIPIAVVPRLTHDLLWLLAPAGVTALLYAIRLVPPWARRPGAAPGTRAIRRGLDVVLWIACATLAAAIVFTAALMLRDIERLHSAWLTAQVQHIAPPASTPTLPLEKFLWWPAVWAGVGAVSLFARWWILQFLGDVAIYLSAYRVSAYDALRDAIQDVCCSAARAVYEHGGYETHVFVGHSLGSVIAYDTLNRLLLDEAVGAMKYAVRERTRGFITFGSPLDKTAYLFRVQADPRSELREGLATAVQPLIADYANRPDWINLWSRADIISSRLDYYDTRTNPANPIVNAIDPFATSPLAAHTQYWKGTELYARLYAMLTRDA
jgi:hypothetical protein